MTTQEDLVQYLVREANRLGRKGIKVIGWVSPQSATSSITGTFVTVPMSAKNASDGDNE